MISRLRLENAAFSYNQQPIFSGLTLELQAGEIFCLLGPNGCGKTTLLRCLNGILPLKTGEVTLQGKDLHTFSDTEKAKQIGFVFQDEALLFPYPVLEIVRMGRAPHLGFFATPSQRDTEIAEAALETVGIAHLRDKAYTEISGGERQLALIARALAQEPQILLMDEPTSHLDYGNQMLILKTIQQLSYERNISVLIATHFPEHALLVSNKVALMKDGEFMAEGHAESIITAERLKMLYNVNVKVVSVSNGENTTTKAIVPLLNALSSRERNVYE
ncbi:MAG: ABC transporter ATP-binding protein [Anaerolineae bacterium]|nr:ABC transporter ATP-binding protein [Anaerolineae bacterium]